MAVETPAAPAVRQSRPEKDTGPDKEGPDLIRAAANGEKLSDTEKRDATEWFLSDEQVVETDTFELNVGTRKKPVWIEWEIRAVDLDELKKIRSQAAGNRSQRRSRDAPELDESEANLRIVLKGTISPDLAAVAKQKGLADPADVLRLKLGRKPGLLGQVAGEVMAISGFDDEDIREVDAGKP